MRPTNLRLNSNAAKTTPVADLEIINGDRGRNQEVLRRKSPMGDQRRSPGGSVGVKSPEADDIF